MLRPPTPRAAVIAALAAAACTTAAACAARGRPAAAAPRRDRAVITRDEMAAVQLPNVLDLVSALRPGWLVPRGRDTLGAPNEIRAYLGATRLRGNLDALRDIPVANLARVEFVGPAAAAARWGLDHGQGAIVVTPGAR